MSANEHDDDQPDSFEVIERLRSQLAAKVVKDSIVTQATERLVYQIVETCAAHEREALAAKDAEIASIREQTLDECERRARGELWFPDRYNSRYFCEVGDSENENARNWSWDSDYAKARNAGAAAIAALKRKGEAT